MLRGSGSPWEAPARPLAALPTRLAPFTPMLFQREELGEVAPLKFFIDQADAEIAAATRAGRRRQFPAFASFEREVPDPRDRATFERSRLRAVI
jgi:maltooligosyltrehalose trehalohydrolase